MNFTGQRTLTRAVGLEFGRSGIRAVLASRQGQRVRLERTLAAAYPPELDGDSAQAVGHWTAARLGEAGFPRAGVIVALSRQAVVLKRVTLPTTAAEELPGMTRLVVQRDLPMAPEAAVIDYVPVRQDGAGTTVMAAAMERRRLQFIEDTARAAALRLDGVSLRCLGCAALLARLPLGPSLLAVDAIGDSVEFNVVVDGSIRFSRAVDLPPLEERGHDALAEAILTEARRTWLSFRAAEDSEPVQHVVILGDPKLGERLAAPLREIVQAPATVLREHPQVSGVGGDDDPPWPLAGLLLERMVGSASINLLRPRQAPDRAAQRRTLALGGVGLALVCFLAAWTVGHQQFLRLSRRSEDLRQYATGALGEHGRFLRDQDKLAHLREWEAIQADWLSHAAKLHAVSPPPTEVVLESWTGALNTLGARWDKAADQWSSSMEIKIILEGEARNRAAADAFRNNLVADETYSTVSLGSESMGGRRLPFPFTYQLQTAQARPAAAEPRTAAAPAGEPTP